MSIQPGDTAPAFTLFSSDKKPVSLSDYKGKNVVLLFFPLAFSSVCTAELCSVRDQLARYNNANADVIAISIDSVFVLDKFKNDQQLNFTLLSDFNKEVSENYGVLYEIFPAFEMRGVSKRAAFLIDGEGIVQYAGECASPGDQPDFEKILSRIEDL
ncbi:MAG: redoxin domain-containing protein [Chitinophagaceae bacterium]|nr:redoxin domain-containing protein [Chitinophagaceae bacterium]